MPSIASRALILLMLAIGATAHAAAQGPARRLSTARELYSAASYEEALAVLNSLRQDEAAAPAERGAVEQYRSLCLLALGRSAEAEDAIAAVVKSDPMYQPSEADASPRVRAAFTDVRQRILPEIALSRYVAAKRRFDAKEYAVAAEEFRRLLRLLDDPDMNGRHADLRVLASGFFDLSVAAAPPPLEVAAEAATPSTGETASSGEDRTYTAEDPGVSPPVPINQQLPGVPASIAAHVRDRGVVEVVVDELGRVVVVTIRVSMHPAYDTLILSAARGWRYRPATIGGTPVKFRKVIQIALAKR